MGTEPLREHLAALPDAPGVYLFRDSGDRVMYVGKAKSLRKRVFSYFEAPVRGPELHFLHPYFLVTVL